MEMSDLSKPEKAKPPKVDLETNSLLLIALIVTVCSGSEHGSDRETRQKIEELHQSVTRLEKKIDALTTAPNGQTAKDVVNSSTGAPP